MPADWRAARLPYQEGAPEPIGYVLEERSSRALWITGAALVALPYFFGIAVAEGSDFKNGTGWLGLPVVGPWVNLAVRHSECRGVPNCSYAQHEGLTRLAIVSSGLLQVTGATLVTLGLMSTKRIWLRSDLAGLELTPLASANGVYGFQVSGAL